MILIRAHDYPKFVSAWLELMKTHEFIALRYEGTAMNFVKILKDYFNIEAVANSGDQWGTFYLHDKDATAFMLRWA